MEIRKITAIFRGEVLEAVEHRLQQLRVPGVTITQVKGYGAYANFSRRDWLVTHARVEIFVGRDRADEIAWAIVEAAHSGMAGDGIVVVSPVESILRIRTKTDATLDELIRGTSEPAVSP